MSVLDKVYMELVRYGEIKSCIESISGGNYTTRRYILYEGKMYLCTLCNGEVISIVIIYKEEV